uniref:DUF868 family protein n=1 Tax=Kalanchoe fedtschenkoi TaxID=63787 RepID=A0A7N0TXT8_KALFE
MFSYHRRIQSSTSVFDPQNPSLAENNTDDFPTYRTAQNSVSVLYQAHIAGAWRNVTVHWTKNLITHSMSITVDSYDGHQLHYQSCKIDLKPWHFWSKKGYKSFDVDDADVEVYWDLRSAKFSGSPEPSSDYYVAIVSDDEAVLLLGDSSKKAYKRTKARPALADAILCYKKEHVFSKKSFSTRSRFDERSQRHYDIVVESSTSWPRDPEMWISVDGIVLIHVKNLQWKFRGNQTISVGSQAVQVFWDVHDWLFKSPGTGNGLFIFKPAAEEEWEDAEVGSGSDGSGSRYHSTHSCAGRSSHFCLFLYAWKLE